MSFSTDLTSVYVMSCSLVRVYSLIWGEGLGTKTELRALIIAMLTRLDQSHSSADTSVRQEQCELYEESK
jgi:hypothetical protein